MKRTTLSAAFILLGIYAGLAVGRAHAAVTTIRGVGEVSKPSGCPDGMSGITYAGGQQFYGVCDIGGKVLPITLEFNSSGRITANTFDAAITVGGYDLEGVAYNAANNSVWVSDESGAAAQTIKERSLSGDLLSEVDVPEIYKSARGNFGLESLTVRGDGLEMWTCNEEALYNGAHGVDDGPKSDKSNGSVVRLQRFTRTSVRAKWVADGQFAYQTEPHSGVAFIGGGSERSGVSDLCVLPDGTLLALERELGGSFMPGYKNHIFEIDYSSASDISNLQKLNGASYTKVAKSERWSKNFFTTYNFEGIALGPKVSGETLSLVLIADGYAGAAAGNNTGLYSLTLEGVSVRDLSVTSAHGVAEPVGNPYRYAYGRELTNSVASPVTMGGKRYVCTGWTLTNGDSPAAGATNSMVMTIKNDGDLTWLWATNYWIDVTSHGNGTVTNGKGWHRKESRITLTATPDAGYEFSRWSGDVPADQTNNATITLTANTPLTAKAHFIETLCTGIDLHAYQAADGIYVEFVALGAQTGKPMELHQIDNNRTSLWSRILHVQPGYQQLYRVRVPDLNAGNRYNFAVREGNGQIWEAANVPIGSFKTVMAEMSLAGITLTFNSLPEREYEIQWVARLGQGWRTVTNVFSDSEETATLVAYPEPPTTSGFWRVLLR